eukprot:1301932-Amphidinium_carterae.1
MVPDTPITMKVASQTANQHHGREDNDPLLHCIRRQAAAKLSIGLSLTNPATMRCRLTSARLFKHVCMA